MSQTGQISVEIIGHCALSAGEIAQKCQQGITSELLALGGEYVLLITQNGTLHICSSIYGVAQYFYTIVDGVLYHGKTVLDVLSQSGLQWEYNYRALADLTALENPLENDTLHKRIHRFPARTILTAVDGEVTEKYYDWSTFHDRKEATPADALNAFNQYVEKYANEDSVVPLSGGMDSRVILSGFLRLGYKPAVVVMGFEDTTDRKIAEQMIAAYGLKSEFIELTLADHLDYAGQITALTGGTMLANHWHWYIFYRKSSFTPQNSLFIGVNGEYARSFYADKGILAQAGNLAPQFALPHYWRTKLRVIGQTHRRIFRADEVPYLSPELAAYLDEEGYRDRIERIVRLCGGTFFPGTDDLYLSQRVRYFMSNGLKLVEPIPTRTPFLNREWVNAITNLPRSEKFGSNWHRYALTQNAPRLLEFPSEKTGKPVKRRAEPLYWLPRPGRKKTESVHYADYPGWFASDEVRSAIEDQKELVSDLFTGELITRILNEHREQRNRPRTIGYLLSQIYFRQQIKEYLRQPVK